MKNAFTCDVEDYYQVEAFKEFIHQDQWDDFPSRVEKNTDKMLSILQERRVKGTFFVLGWVAKRFPDLVKRIHREGHEIASHGYSHEMITHQTPQAFRKDIRASKSLLESIIGEPICGYRAPTFSIMANTLWALEILVEEGFRYDSSIFPIRHDRYGIPDAKRFLHKIQTPSGEIWEFPPTTLRFLKNNWPIAGGGYLRFLPQSILHWGFRYIERLNVPALIYLHPWEIDLEQPRIKARFISRVRQYMYLEKTEKKMRFLLSRFAFTRMWDVIQEYERTS